MSKIENLTIELGGKIKELILNILKDFNISKYKIQIDVGLYDNKIIISKDCIDIVIIVYIIQKDYSYFNLYVCDNMYKLLKPSYKEQTCSNMVYKMDSFLEQLENEPIKIIRELYSHKEQIENELKNILE